MCEKEMYIYVVFVEEENHSNSYGKFRREFHVTPIIGDTIFVDEANKERELHFHILNSGIVFKRIILKKQIIIYAYYKKSETIERKLKELTTIDQI
jgi:hypothetical protein